jgi:stage V sporulation protein R
LHLYEYFLEEDKGYVTEVADEKGWEKIRDTLCVNVGMGSIPVIKVKEMSAKDRTLILEHEYDGRDLEMTYAGQTLKYMVELWGRPAELLTKLKEKEKRLICNENKRISVID